MIYDELTGEIIENPDLTKGKVYTEEKVIGHKEAQRVLLEGSITDFDPEGCWMEIPAEDITETVEKYHKYTIDELIEQQQAAIKPNDTSISQEKNLSYCLMPSLLPLIQLNRLRQAINGLQCIIAKQDLVGNGS